MKVFVIEDNPVYNDYVCNLLKKDSFDTMSAYNLATAKKLLAKSEVDDIVVADLRLPDGESIELLRWMRAEGVSKCAPSFFMHKAPTFTSRGFVIT